MSAPRPPDWYRDPGGTHDYRYWDGERWTDGVATGGVVSEEPLPEDERIRLPGRVALIGLGAAVLSILAQGVLFAVGTLVNDFVAFVLAEIGLYGGFYLTCRMISRSRGTGDVRRDFGITYRKGDWYRGLATSLLARVAAVVVSLLLYALSEDLAGTNTEVFEEHGTDWTLLALFAVSALVFAPFFEELFFRGLIQRSLESALPAWAALGLQACVFGLFHLGGAEGAGNVGVIAATAAAGVLFGVVARKYQRLGVGIAGHAWFNLLPVAVLLLDR